MTRDAKIILGHIEAEAGIHRGRLVELTNWPTDRINRAVQLLKGTDHIQEIGNAIFRTEQLSEFAERARTALENFHEKNPREAGVKADTLLRWSGFTGEGRAERRFLDWLVAKKHIAMAQGKAKLPDWQPSLTDRQRKLVDRVSELLEQMPPPTPAGIAHQLGVPVQTVDAALKLGVETGEFALLEGGVHWRMDQLRNLWKRLIRELPATFGVKEVKEHLDLPRSHASRLVQWAVSEGMLRSTPQGYSRSR